MKFAAVNGERQEAQPNLSGTCPACGAPMVAKCGEVKIWHWAHRGRRVCDVWWENETEWHRAWKGHFPVDWQEVVHTAKDGVKHIADVKTERGWALEFQHSYIDAEERRSRNGFYGKVIWVVNGLRRKKDGEQLSKALNSGMPIGGNPPVMWRVSTEKCGLLREWASSGVPIFFDFGGDTVLWWLLSGLAQGVAYVGPYSRPEFIKIHRGETPEAASDFDSFVNDIGKLARDFEAHLARSAGGRRLF